MLSNWRNLIIPAAIWAVVATIGDMLVAKVLNLPPGYASTSAAGQVVTGQIFTIVAFSVGSGVVCFAVYFIIVFRGSNRSAPQPRIANSNLPIQLVWMTASIILVLFAAGLGTAELEGQVNPSLGVPAQAKAAGAARDPLIIQVIAQQWQFTYRYPQYGGLETQQLRMPVGRLVQFDVTSLDVTHQFWAEQIAVRLDADPGVNNIGYVYVLHPTTIDVRCGELCGLWHGYMTDLNNQAGRALTTSQWNSWVSYAEATYGPEAHNLPSFSLTYFPQPLTY